MEEERAPGPRSNLWRLVTSNAASSKNVCSWWQRGTCSCGVPSQNKTQNCTCCIISTNQTQSMQTRLERSIPRVTTVFFFLFLCDHDVFLFHAFGWLLNVLWCIFLNKQNNFYFKNDSSLSAGSDLHRAEGSGRLTAHSWSRSSRTCVLTETGVWFGVRLMIEPLHACMANFHFSPRGVSQDLECKLWVQI